jgi:hypothetical protein
LPECRHSEACLLNRVKRSCACAAEILHTPTHSFSVNRGTGKLARVVRGGRADFQAMAVPDGAFAAVVGHLEILG